MKKLIKLAVAILAFGFFSSAFAQELILHVGHKNGGIGALMQTILAEELETRGWKVNFKIIGNCGQVKDTFLNSDKLVLAGWATDWQNGEDKACHIPLESSQFVNIFAITPRFLCGPLNNPDFKIEKGKVYRVAVNSGQLHHVMLNDLGAKLGVTFKAIGYKNSNFVRQAQEAQEVDMAYSNNGLPEHIAGTQRCFYSTSDTESHGIKPLKTVLSGPYTKAVFAAYLILNKNADKNQDAKLRKDIMEIMQGARYQSVLKSKSSYILTGDKSKQIDYLKEVIKAY